MLTDQDIQKIVEANKATFATKGDVLVLKEEIGGQFEHMAEILASKEDINNLVNSVDAYAKKVNTNFQEQVVLTEKVKRHDGWLHQLAEKIGIRLEY